jgi:hypothetical protein
MIDEPSDDISIHEHDARVAIAEKELADARAAVFEKKFPKFPAAHELTALEASVALAEKKAAEAKAAAEEKRVQALVIDHTEHAETIADLERRLAEAKAERDHQDFPKWVSVHESHIHVVPAKGEFPEHKSTPGFVHHHIDRDGNVTVMVHDSDEEAKATSAKEEHHEPVHQVGEADETDHVEHGTVQ